MDLNWVRTKETLTICIVHCPGEVTVVILKDTCLFFKTLSYHHLKSDAAEKIFFSFDSL